jgi:hypothetical protein
MKSSSDSSLPVTVAAHPARVGLLLASLTLLPLLRRSGAPG